MKNMLESIGNGAYQIEQRISNPEDKNLEIIQVEDKRELRLKTEEKPCKSYQTLLWELT